MNVDKKRKIFTELKPLNKSILHKCLMNFGIELLVNLKEIRRIWQIQCIILHFTLTTHRAIKLHI